MVFSHEIPAIYTYKNIVLVQWLIMAESFHENSEFKRIASYLAPPFVLYSPFKSTKEKIGSCDLRECVFDG